MFAAAGKIVLQEMQANEEQSRWLILVIGSGHSPDAVLNELASTGQSYNPVRQRAHSLIVLTNSMKALQHSIGCACTSCSLPIALVVAFDAKHS